MLNTIYRLHFIRFKNKRVDGYYKRLIGKLANVLLPLYYELSPGKKRTIGTSGDNPKLIVSLTSYPSRIDNVWLTIETILDQSVKPDAILLWLYRGETVCKDALPARLNALKKRGVQIRFCNDNLMPHKKYFYTMGEFPEATVITVDDDVFYPPDLIRKLLNCHQKHPRAICCVRARKITLDEDGKPNSYEQWINLHHNTRPSYLNMAIGVGAPLYPPGCLHKEAFNKDNLLKLSHTADDLWLKVMSLKKNTKVVALGGEYSRYYIPIKQKNKESLEDINVGKGHNDLIFARLVDHYRINLNDYSGNGLPEGTQ